MISNTEIIDLSNGLALGVSIDLGNADFLLIKADKGYAVCGYFNSKVIDEIGDSAVQVKGVKSIKEMLNKQVDFVSKSAKKLGVNNKMTVKQALQKFV